MNAEHLFHKNTSDGWLFVVGNVKDTVNATFALPLPFPLSLFFINPGKYVQLCLIFVTFPKKTLIVQHNKVENWKVQHKKVQYEKVQHEKVQHNKLQQEKWNIKNATPKSAT